MIKIKNDNFKQDGGTLRMHRYISSRGELKFKVTQDDYKGNHVSYQEDLD